MFPSNIKYKAKMSVLTTLTYCHVRSSTVRQEQEIKYIDYKERNLPLCANPLIVYIGNLKESRRKEK